MKIAVRYYTKSGNTKKLAEGIAKAIGVKALPISEPLSEDVDILFLGSSVYAGGVVSDVKNFISSIDVSVGKIVNFSTAALIESTYKQVKKLIEKKGIQMSDKEFHCRGSFTLMHRGKPDKKDIQNAANFAKEIVGR
ncbi:hypothetical protein SH2C18_14610 [Clostridium sediminicola]|uniref:flavodoxin family protein n=1 Tax=Clostridium sediminicola TaxID=3114879 RepID=UPI0031F24790